MKLVIKMMTKREKGYIACASNTPEEATEKIKALRLYYNPIDIYFMIKE